MYPPSRSMLADLHEGATDGKYKKVVYDRGGMVEDLTYRERADLLDHWYGIHEKRDKMAGDGISGPTPNFVQTPPAGMAFPL
jgi:hypothetical protein